MTRLIEYMNSVGEHFEVQTDGYYRVRAFFNAREAGTESVRLRCELDDETVEIEAFVPLRDLPASPSAIAREIAHLFDRTERPHAKTWTDLPERTLVELERRALLVRNGAKRRATGPTP